MSPPQPGDKPKGLKIYADPITVNCRKVLAGMTTPQEVLSITMGDEN